MALSDILNRKQAERNALVKEFRDLLAAAFPDATMTEITPMEFHVEGGGIKGSTVYLENLYRKIDGHEESVRQSEIQRHFQALTRPLDELQDTVTRDNIVPMIKDQVYIDGTAPSYPMVKEHLAADLWIVYAVDLPTKMLTLRIDQLEAISLQPHELREIAIENLQNILPQAEVNAADDWYLISARDYTASLLLIDSVWDQLSEHVQGDLVAAVPARDVILFTGSSSASGIAAIRARAAEIAQGGSYTISETLLRRKENRWIAFS